MEIYLARDKLCCKYYKVSCTKSTGKGVLEQLSSLICWSTSKVHLIASNRLRKTWIYKEKRKMGRSSLVPESDTLFAEFNPLSGILTSTVFRFQFV